MFDEDDAIEYIRRELGDAVERYDDDELLNIIDMIWDYYELNGMLEIDDDSDEEEDEASLTDDIIEYVRKTLRKDKGAHIDPADVAGIVRAARAYEASAEDEDQF